MKFVASLLLASAALSLGACTVLPQRAEPLPLQLQSFQTQEFEVDQTTAMRAVMSVFQDLGYIIQSADKDVGFITATSPMRVQTTTFLDLVSALANDATPVTGRQTKATAVIEEIRANVTTVRLNFVVSTRSNTPGVLPKLDEPLQDPEPYTVAFSKIGDAIFVRTAGRTAPSAAPAAATSPPAPVPAPQVAPQPAPQPAQRIPVRGTRP